MARYLLAFTLLFSLSVYAAIDAYEFPDEIMAARYDALIAELRCPNCLNTNIAGSDAMIAQDLRREIHRMLLEGSTDDEILEYMRDRYGDFILYDPRLSSETLLLWFGPLLLLAITLAIFITMMRRRGIAASLSAEERESLDRLLKEKDL